MTFLSRLFRLSGWIAPVLLTGVLAGPAFAQVAPGQQVPLPPGNVGGAGAQTLAPTAAPNGGVQTLAPNTGATGAGTFLAQSNPAAEAQTNIRVDRLEGELRNLVGQMEQLMFQMRQLQDELTRAREDTEFRLRELEGNGINDGSGMPMERGAIDGSSADGGATDAQLRDVLLARERGDPARDLGTLSVGQDGQSVGATIGDPNGPLDLSSLTLNAAPEVRPQPPLSGAVASIDPLESLSPNDVYELGYDHVLRGDYGQAVSTFSDFIDLYPEDRLRPNAHFWLGESHFAMGAYTPAAEQFLAVFNNYPEDVKVPDALLKLAMSLERLGAQQQACATFTKLLSDYPRAPQIVLDTARTEQGLAGC
ncbi:MAG: tol-pal system protein YbgF [Hyphomicrobiales bacterium]